MYPQLTPDVFAYLDELAADLAANGGMTGRPLDEAIKATHEHRQAFALERREGESKRAKMARKALQSSICRRARLSPQNSDWPCKQKTLREVFS